MGNIARTIPDHSRVVKGINSISEELGISIDELLYTGVSEEKIDELDKEGLIQDSYCGMVWFYEGPEGTGGTAFIQGLDEKNENVVFTLKDLELGIETNIIIQDEDGKKGKLQITSRGNYLAFRK